MSSYFQISPTTAYGSTIYVHSHARSIKYELMNVTYRSALMDLINLLENAANQTIANLDTVIDLLESTTQDLIDAGYPTQNGKPYGLTEKYKEYRKLMMDFYSLVTNAKTMKRKKIDSTTAKNFWDIVLDEFNKNDTVSDILVKLNVSGEIADIVTQRLEAMRIKRKNSKKIDSQLFVKNIKTLTAEELIKLFRDQRKKEDVILDSTKKELEKSVMVVRNALKEWKELLSAAEKYAPILANPNIKDINLKQLVDRVFGNNALSLIVKQGYLVELISTFMGDGVDNMERGLIDYQNSNGTITVTQQSIGDKQGFYYGDEITTDIKILVDTADRAFGISAKLNPSYFLKSVHLTSQEQEDLLPNWKQLNINGALVYFLTNYAILSKMEYPSDDKKIRDQYKKTGVMPGPISGSTSLPDSDLFERLKNAIMINLFIKGVIGSLFMASAQPKNYSSFMVGIEQQGMPIIIQTSVGQYWSKDLLRSIRDLAQSGRLSEIFKNMPKNPIEPIIKRVNSISSAFVELFQLKVDYAFENPVTPDYDGDRYAEIAEEEVISSKMEEIVDELWDGKDRDNVLSKIMNLKTVIRFKYDEYL